MLDCSLACSHQWCHSSNAIFTTNGSQLLMLSLFSTEEGTGVELVLHLGVLGKDSSLPSSEESTSNTSWSSVPGSWRMSTEVNFNLRIWKALSTAGDDWKGASVGVRSVGGCQTTVAEHEMAIKEVWELPLEVMDSPRGDRGNLYSIHLNPVH